MSSRAETASVIGKALAGCSQPMPGIVLPARRDTFVQQLVESVRRVEYLNVVQQRGIAHKRGDPASAMFDPLLAAVLASRSGHLDEACWLVFLSVHFGRHRTGGWSLARAVYGRMGNAPVWTWDEVSADVLGFRAWLNKSKNELTSVRGAKFGNHRKYESLNAYGDRGTGAAVATYVDWILSNGGHAKSLASGSTPRSDFARLYSEMASVASFGRTARFDYLSMLGELGLAKIEPNSTYLVDSTGPLKGARLLFEAGDVLSKAALQSMADSLADAIGVGMRPMEDALCNWQKSPDTFKPFRG